MGYVRPKSEQLENLQSRRAGLSLTELLVVMAISSIVLFTVTMISTLSLRSAALTNASMAIDEEVTKLHTSIRSIVSRQWTVLKEVQGIEGDDQIIDGTTIILWSNIPSPDPPGWSTRESRIEFDESNKQLIHRFEVDTEGEEKEFVTNVLVKYLDSIAFSIEPEAYMKYRAELSYPSSNNPDRPIVQRVVEGVVRFY
jgi:prepilin-type N-terminal cleavage/methylation domain-containing protein